MKLTTRILVSSLALASVSALALAAPAFAAPASGTTGNTTATFTVGSGALTISVPTPATFNSTSNSVGGGTVTGMLGVVTVTDARSAAGITGWSTSVSSSDFTGGTPIIKASAVGYSAGVVTTLTGSALYTTTNQTNIAGDPVIVTAANTTGNDLASWNPTITIAVPGGTTPGIYSTTITHSIL